MGFSPVLHPLQLQLPLHPDGVEGVHPDGIAFCRQASPMEVRGLDALPAVPSPDSQAESTSDHKGTPERQGPA